MLRSMTSAVAGLKTHQSKMDVIGNNLANSNTAGYKSSRAVFKDVFYQTISGASSATGNRGGTSASQIGYGSSLAGISVLHTRGGFISTGAPTDCAIDGDGFFIVGDAYDATNTTSFTDPKIMQGNAQTYNKGDLKYTRLGMFTFDANGVLCDPSGRAVYGWNAKYDSSGKIADPTTDFADPGAAGTNTTGNPNSHSGTTFGPIIIPDISKYKNISIDSNGKITGIPEGAKDPVCLGILAVANFKNVNGLQQSGSTYFQTTGNSGNPMIAPPNNNSTGTIQSSYLEGANVDLSQEFTDMITTQRGFQANSRVITTSDEMLQELVNLKR